MSNQIKLANSTTDGRVSLLLNPDGTADCWNSATQRLEHQLSCAASIRHALRHDFAQLTLAGIAWLKEHATS